MQINPFYRENISSKRAALVLIKSRQGGFLCIKDKNLPNNSYRGDFMEDKCKKKRPKMIVFEEGKYYRDVKDMKRKDIRQRKENKD